jgi:plasmid stabilization system protein ParE
VKVRFLRVAQAELREAVRWYDSEAPGLGAGFLLEVVAAIARITEFPSAWQTVESELRRCRVGKFPYGLVYADENDEILIVALSHLQRRPQSWRVRLSEKT